MSLATFSHQTLSPIDVANAAKTVGPSIARGKLLGCENEDQGVLLALMSFQEGKPIRWYMQRYHIFGGKMTMRADAMLAGLREVGGDYKVLRRDADGASIEISHRGQVQTFSLSWADAQKESFVYCKDKKTLKDTWATPRGRTAMLWARVASDAIRAAAPEVNAGYYTPEEFDAAGDQVQDVEFSVAPQQPTAALPVPESKPTASAPLAESAPTAAPAASAPAETPAASAPAEKPNEPAINREPRVPVDEATVAKIKELIVSTGVPVASIVTRLKASGMSKLAEMTMGDAQQLLIHLQERKNLDEWLTLPLTPPGNSPGRES